MSDACRREATGIDVSMNPLSSPRTAPTALSRCRAPLRCLGLAAIVALCWTDHGGAAEPEPAPVRIAVFPFELEDFTAAAEAGETPYLAEATREAKRQLTASGRYEVVDTSGADLGQAKAQGLRHCNGCEAAIARELGADQALLGVVSRVSRTEYLVRFQVSDARTGEVISKLTTDLRMGADYSWPRGVRWLMQNRMLASDAADGPGG